MDGLQLALDFGKGAITTMERQLERADHRLVELEGLLGSSQLGAITSLLGHCGYTRYGVLVDFMLAGKGQRLTHLHPHLKIMRSYMLCLRS